MAVTAVVVPVLLLQYRRFWNQRRFWITVFLMTAVQVPLVVAVRTLMDQARSLLCWPLAQLMVCS